MWLHSLKVAQLLRSAASLHTNQSRSYLNHLVYIYIYKYRVSLEECEILREGISYVKLYRYNPKHLCPKLNGYGDNGQKKCGHLAFPRTVFYSCVAH